LRELLLEEARIKGVSRARKPLGQSPGLRSELGVLRREIEYAREAALDPNRARVRTLQLYGGGKEIAVIDLFQAGYGVLARIGDMRIVGHNAQFELKHLQHLGVEPAEVHCTMQACRLLYGRHLGLATAAEAMLGVTLDKAQQTSDWSVERLTDDQIRYAALDAWACHRIAAKTLRNLDRQASAYSIQTGCLPAVARMETAGVAFEKAAHGRLIDAWRQERVAAAAAFVEACRESGLDDLTETPKTPAEVERLLQTLLTSEQLATWLRTEKSGKLSTRRSELLRVAQDYPPIARLIDAYKIDKLSNSFGPSLAAKVSPVTNRIHASYNVAATASGRASCSGPNLQQMPGDRSDPRVRRLFIAPPGRRIIAADYALMELRYAAWRSRDVTMLEAFENGVDLHALTASRLLNKPVDEVTKQERHAAKPVNFGSIYGMGKDGLVKSAWDNYRLLLTPMQAESQLVVFDNTYLGFVTWRSQHSALCKATGVIWIGADAAGGAGRIYRREWMPLGKSFYTRSANFPVQGGTADISMNALALVDERLFEAGLDAFPVLWVHDEIALESREDHSEQAVAILRDAMVETFRDACPGVPLRGCVDVHIAASWGEAKG
jgi:DNA polymerase I